MLTDEGVVDEEFEWQRSESAFTHLNFTRAPISQGTGPGMASHRGSAYVEGRVHLKGSRMVKDESKVAVFGRDTSRTHTGFIQNRNYPNHAHPDSAKECWCSCLLTS